MRRFGKTEMRRADSILAAGNIAAQSDPGFPSRTLHVRDFDDLLVQFGVTISVLMEIGAAFQMFQVLYRASVSLRPLGSGIGPW